MLKRHRRFSLHTALIAQLFAASGFAAAIHGKVVLWGEPVAGGVVAIDDLRIATPNPPTRIIDHRDLRLTPNVLVVPVGTTIHFENSDGMPCHLYSGSRAASFVLRPEDHGPRILRLSQGGVVELSCAEHSTAHAFILVRDNPYYALTDTSGAYRIANLPAGRYRVSLWYEGKAIETRHIEVGQRDLEVDFHSNPPRLHGFNQSPDIPEITLETSVSPAFGSDSNFRR